MANDTNTLSEKDQKIMKFALEVDYQIVKSDMVTIEFTRGQPLYNVEVLSTPKMYGDPWIVRHINGEIIYVGSFEKIIKHSTSSANSSYPPFDDAPDDDNLPF